MQVDDFACMHLMFVHTKNQEQGTTSISPRKREPSMLPPESCIASRESHMEEQGSTMAMDVDEVDAIDMFGEGPLGGGEHLRLADADFFNSFQDDFDDSDIN
ncbi:hypothetical protein HAX54_023574 [Datura stramonium]|uniref:Small acidic protein 1 n=1 Tax=Datura stramonium TaxID=4076 RepID=A0ABS8UYP9_DATST|nr:hypothetical protein [Datura stramonium]